MLRLSDTKGPRAGLSEFEADLLCEHSYIAPDIAVSTITEHFTSSRCLDLLRMVEYGQEEQAERASLLTSLDAIYRTMHLWENDFYAAGLLKSIIRTAHLYAHGEASQAAFLDAQQTIDRANLKLPSPSPARWAVDGVIRAMQDEPWMAAYYAETALSYRIALVAKRGVEDLPTRNDILDRVWDRGGLISFSALLGATDRHAQAVTKATSKLYAAHILSELPFRLPTLVHLCEKVLEVEVDRIAKALFMNAARTIALKTMEATDRPETSDRSAAISIAHDAGREYARQFNPYDPTCT